MRRLPPIAALVATLILAAPAAAASPDVVISQLYGAGGNSGAPVTNDFVELFNRGTAARERGRLVGPVRLRRRDLVGQHGAARRDDRARPPLSDRALGRIQRHAAARARPQRHDRHERHERQGRARHEHHAAVRVRDGLLRAPAGARLRGLRHGRRLRGHGADPRARRAERRLPRRGRLPGHGRQRRRLQPRGARAAQQRRAGRAVHGTAAAGRGLRRPAAGDRR